jgi:hypothetical protein
MRNGEAEFPSGRDIIERATPPNLTAQRTPHDVVRGLEMRRRSRLVRIVTIGVIIPILVLIPSTFIPRFDGASLIALLAGLAGVVAAYVLNRMGLVSAASLTLVGGIAVAIAFVLVGKSINQHGLDLNDLRLYDLFLIPIVLSGVLAGRRGPLILTAITSTFTVVSLLVLPKTPTLQAYWDATYPYVLGSAYDVLAIAFFAQWLTAAAAWLGADSVRRALLDASRADELAAANERVVAQARQIEAQQQRLREGILQIQAVHSAIARGQWSARARVQESELLPLAMSLNLLLDRLTGLKREQEQRQRMDRAATELAVALRRTRAGEPYTPPPYTGTPFDEVLVELSVLRNATPGSA